MLFIARQQEASSIWSTRPFFCFIVVFRLDLGNQCIFADVFKAKLSTSKRLLHMFVWRWLLAQNESQGVGLDWCLKETRGGE